MAQDKDEDWVSYFGDFNATKKHFPNDVTDENKISYSYSDNQTGPLDFSNFTTDDFCQSNHSHAYLNVTCEFPINYAEPMYG